MNKEMTRFTYLDYEKGFNLIGYIKTISESPKQINIFADQLESDYHPNKFIVDSIVCDISLLIKSFPETKINVVGEVLYNYLFEIIS